MLNFFLILVALTRRHAYLCKHIILNTNIYEVLQINVKELTLNKFLLAACDITSDIHILSVTLTVL